MANDRPSSKDKSASQSGKRPSRPARRNRSDSAKRRAKRPPKDKLRVDIAPSGGMDPDVALTRR